MRCLLEIEIKEANRIRSMKTPSYVEVILSKRLSRIGIESLCVASFCSSCCGAILAAENPEPAGEVDLSFVNLAEHSPSIAVDIPYATKLISPL